MSRRPYRYVRVDHPDPAPRPRGGSVSWGRVFRHLFWYAVTGYVWYAAGFGAAIIAGVILACFLAGANYRRNPHCDPWQRVDRSTETHDPSHPYDNL